MRVVIHGLSDWSSKYVPWLTVLIICASVAILDNLWRIWTKMCAKWSFTNHSATASSTSYLTKQEILIPYLPFHMLMLSVRFERGPLNSLWLLWLPHNRTGPGGLLFVIDEGVWISLLGGMGNNKERWTRYQLRATTIYAVKSDIVYFLRSHGLTRWY